MHLHDGFDDLAVQVCPDRARALGGGCAVGYSRGMRITGRFVRIFQWIAPVAMPLLVMVGKSLLGAPSGWMMLFAIIFGPIVVLAMYVPPVIVAFDRQARAARGTRLAYDIASYVIWGAFVLIMLTLVDGGDSPPFGSVLSIWGLIDDDLSSVLTSLGFFIAVLAWLTAIITASLGVAASRGALTGAPVGYQAQPGFPPAVQPGPQPGFPAAQPGYPPAVPPAPPAQAAPPAPPAS